GQLPGNGAGRQTFGLMLHQQTKRRQACRLRECRKAGRCHLHVHMSYIIDIWTQKQSRNTTETPPCLVGIAVAPVCTVRSRPLRPTATAPASSRPGLPIALTDPPYDWTQLDSSLRAMR